MFLAKRKNGIWYIVYTNSFGKRNAISAKTRFKKEAYHFLSCFEDEVKNQKNNKVIPIDLKAFTFNYLKQSESIHRPKTTKQLKTIFKMLQDHLGNVQLSSITLIDIKGFLQEKHSVSPFTAQKYLAYLRKAFSDAVSDGYLLSNPFDKIENFKIPEKQPLFFTESEFQELLKVIDDNDLKHLVIFSTHTGLRQMEALTLKWNQINFKDRYLILDNNSNITKSQKVGTVPLNITALQILTEREMTKESEFVFTYKGKEITQDFISKKFKKYVIKAGLNPKYRFHTLRHTNASWMVQRGASILNVSKILRHSNVKVSEIYSHLKPDNLLNTIELLNN